MVQAEDQADAKALTASPFTVCFTNSFDTFERADVPVTCADVPVTRAIPVTRADVPVTRAIPVADHLGSCWQRVV